MDNSERMKDALKQQAEQDTMDIRIIAVEAISRMYEGHGNQLSQLYWDSTFPRECNRIVNYIKYGT